MGNEINVSKLKLPPKRAVHVDKGVREAMSAMHEHRLENLKAGVADIDKTAVNNAFLWLLAAVPLVWLAFLFLFVANPLEIRIGKACSLWLSLGESEYMPRMFESLFWAATITIFGMNTVFGAMDERELSMRGKSAGNGFVLACAFCLVPVYLWFRGKPALNDGTRKIAPYAVWWLGWMLIDFLAENIAALVIEAAIAVIPVIVAACMSSGKTAATARENAAAASASAAAGGDSVNDALGI